MADDPDARVRELHEALDSLLAVLGNRERKELSGLHCYQRCIAALAKGHAEGLPVTVGLVVENVKAFGEAGLQVVRDLAKSQREPKLGPIMQAILDELAVAGGQTETEIKMHLGMDQRSSLSGTLVELETSKLVRCDGAERWWVVEP